MGREFLEITEKKKVEEIISNISEKVAETETKAKTKTGEKVKIDEALGRVASADIFSPLNIPPFDRAVMDGYAVVAADTFYADENKPSSLIIKGYSHVGEFPEESIEKGYCMGISTGAPIPSGANAVAMIEHADEYINELEKGRKRKKVKIYKPVAPAENIMAAGSDIKRAERIVRKGTVLTPRETGVLAACGIKEFFVYKKPKIAILSTGNEIIALGEDLKPGKIYDINAQTIGDSIRESGCIPLFFGIAKDSIEELSEKIKDALEKNADVIIASGGTSAGVGDILPKVISELGEILVHGVNIKPGKPFIFGMIEGKPIFGLPGNPTSVLITFDLFVAPLLKRMAGISNYEEWRMKIKANAAVRIFSEKGRNEYMLVNLVKERKGGKSLVYPILTGSGAITTLSKAEGYIFVEKGKEIIDEGEEVEVDLLTQGIRVE